MLASEQTTLLVISAYANESAAHRLAPPDPGLWGLNGKDTSGRLLTLLVMER